MFMNLIFKTFKGENSVTNCRNKNLHSRMIIKVRISILSQAGFSSLS